MDYLHVKNLEKHHPGYKDRTLLWCKTYFAMLNGDPEFELLCEIDKWRFLAFIMLELQIKKPVPLDIPYLKRKGFDIKMRPISLTIQMLHNFIEIGSGTNASPCDIREENRVDNKREDGVTHKTRNSHLHDEDFLKALKQNPAYTGIDIDQELSRMDAWLLTRPGRSKTRRFVVNWLNRRERPLQIKPPTKVAAPKTDMKKIKEEAAPPPAAFSEMVKRLAKQKSAV